jgi:hypothetical protein
MTPEQRARKRQLIERMREANIVSVRLTLDEATYLLNAASLPDLEARLEAVQSAVLSDRENYKTLYENLAATHDDVVRDKNEYKALYEHEKSRGDVLQKRLNRIQEKLSNRQKT